jgi:ABC-type sulfate/molybdate transport systems ATPase subunit
LLIIADDPLAAVDAAVGNTLFESLQGFASGCANDDGGRRSVVLAMNQPHLLQSCTHLVHLEDGRVVAQGSYEKVVATSPSFSKMIFSSKVKHNSHNAELEGLEAQTVVSTEQIQLAAADSTADNADLVELVQETAVGKEEEEVVFAKIQVEGEKRTTGSVQRDVVSTYFAAFGHRMMALSVLVAFATWAVAGFNDRWLAAWIQAAETDEPKTARYIAGWSAVLNH